MSDYTKTVDFAAKDALASANPAKAAKGTEVDTEYNNISTAIATKFDVNDRNVANGIAPLDAGILVPPANLPVATETAIGALEIGTAAEVNALTATDKIIPPSKLGGGINAHNQTLLGIVDDLHTFVDPNADRVFGWDDTAGAAIGFSFGSGLATSGTVLDVAEAGVDHDTLLNFVANKHIDHAAVTLTGGTGISSTGLGDLTASRTINAEVASETVQGVVERANQAEVDAGTDSTRYISPLTLINTY